MTTRSVALVLVILTAACATGPKDAPSATRNAGGPGIGGAPGSPETRPDRAVTKGPMPVDLVTVLRLARARDLDLALVKERLEEAYAREMLAYERLIPSVFAGGRFVRHEGITQATEGEFLDVDKQSAFAGGVIRADWSVGEAVFAILSAEQLTAAGRFAVGQAEETALLRAGEAYLDLVAAVATEAVAAETVSLSESLVRETQAKVEAGAGFRGDLLRAQAQMHEHRVKLALAGVARAKSGARLARTLNLPEHVELVPVDRVPVRLALVKDRGDVELLIATALAARQEIRRAAHVHEAALRRVDQVTYGPLIPNISAEASLGTLGHVFDDLDGSHDARVTLGWTIGPGGLFDLGRQRVSESVARSASIEVSRIRAAIVEEVREGFAEVGSRSDALAAAEAAARDALEARNLYRQRLTTGVGLPLELVLAEETLARTRTTLIDATASYDKAELRLLHATGSLIASGAAGGKP